LIDGDAPDRHTPAHRQWLADCVLQAAKSFLDSLGYAKHMMHRF